MMIQPAATCRSGARPMICGQASDAYRNLETNHSTMTPTAKTTKSKSANQNSSVLLMSGHTTRARANSIRSNLFAGMRLAISLSQELARLSPANANGSDAGRQHRPFNRLADRVPKPADPSQLRKKCIPEEGRVRARRGKREGKEGS